MRKSLFILSCLLLSVAAISAKPKSGPGLFPGVNEGEGNTTGDNSCGTEVTLPIGLPVAAEEGDAVSFENGTTSNIVYTFDLSQEDGASSINQTHSAFEKAKNMNAACVLIRIDGFAGGWDVAENIRQEIISYDRPVMVYVNNQTIPAANFISLGADSIYTKKGSAISNKKASVNNKPAPAKTTEVKNTVAVSAIDPTSSADETFSSDATMNEILYKAGLSNLTVVEHEASFAERANDFMMNPVFIMAVLLLIGFVMRKTVSAKLPGPAIYLLALVVLLYLAPFQLAGLANSGEILATVALIIAAIASARYNKRWLTALFLVGLSFILSLVRAGDTDAIVQYGSFSELVSLPAIPLGLVILGWWIGKVANGRKAETVNNNLVANSAVLANAA